MNRRGPKGQLGTLSSGKRKIQEKLQKLEEEREAAIATINAFVAKTKDAATQLLQVEQRNAFFSQYPSVSQQLEKCIDNLYLFQTTLIEGSDVEEEEESNDKSYDTDGRSNITGSLPAINGLGTSNSQTVNATKLSACPQQMQNARGDSSCAAASFPSIPNQISNNVLNTFNTSNEVTDSYVSVVPSVKEKPELSSSLSEGNSQSPVQLALESKSLQPQNIFPVSSMPKVDPPSSASTISSPPILFNRSGCPSPTFSTVSVDTPFTSTPSTSVLNHRHSKSFDNEQFIRESHNSTNLLPVGLDKTLSSSKSSFYSIKSPQASSCSEYSLCSEGETVRENSLFESNNESKVSNLVEKHDECSVELSSHINFQNKFSYVIPGDEISGASCIIPVKIGDSFSESQIEIRDATLDKERNALDAEVSRPNRFENQRLCESTTNEHTTVSGDVLDCVVELANFRFETYKSNKAFPFVQKGETLYSDESHQSNVLTSNDHLPRNVLDVLTSQTPPTNCKQEKQLYISLEETSALQGTLKKEEGTTDVKACNLDADTYFKSSSSLNTADTDQYISDDDEFLSGETEWEGAKTIEPSSYVAASNIVSETNVLVKPETNFDSKPMPAERNLNEICSKDPGDRVSEKCQIPPPIVPFGSRVAVKVRLALSPHDFYVLIADEKTLENICLVGNRLRSNVYAPKKMKRPFVVNACCAILATAFHDSWQRAKITKCLSADQVEVMLVDFGTKMRVPVSSLYELDPDIASTYPESTIHCSLKDVEPLTEEWSEEAILTFCNIVTMYTMQANFHPRGQDGKFPVELTVTNYEVPNIDVSKYLIAAQCAKQKSQTLNSKPIIAKAIANGNSSMTVTPNDTGAAALLQAESQQKKACAQYRWNAQIKPCEVKPNEYDQFVFVVSFVVSPSEFYVHIPDEDVIMLDELREQMNSFYGGTRQVPKVTRDLVRVGTHWCTPYSRDDFWYRVKVIDVIEKDGQAESLYKVQHVDYGSTEEVSLDKLRPMTVEFAEPPAFAVRCSLANIKPKNGTSWDPGAVTLFTDLTGFEKLLTGEIANRDNDSELSLFVWDSIGSSDVLVNTLLISHGQAAIVTDDDTKKDSENHVQDDDLAEWDPMSSDYNSLRNNYQVDIDDAGVALAGYKAKDERYICRYFSRFGRCKDDVFCKFQHIYKSEIPDDITLDTIEETICSNVLQLPAKNSVVYVQVSAVFNPSHFYVVFPLGTMHAAFINDMYTADDQLNDLLDEISDHYTKSRHTEDLTLIPAIGSMVAVEDESNRRWYRARVLIADEEFVTVFYIDSGHRESVPRQNVRRLLPQFLQLPGQAVECFMDVKPKNKAWSPEARLHFKNLIKEKLLLAEILCVGKSSLYVDLHSRTNDAEVHVCTELVDKDLAVMKVPKKAEFPMQEKKEKITYIPG